ncbi:MAG: glycoside hydrolase family 9 protein [Ignavibacteriaceae bacterium]
MNFRFLAVFLFLPLSLIKPGNVFVNQAGYLPNLNKFVYATQHADSFFVVEKGSSKVFFHGNLNFITSNDPSTGLTIYRGDFSSFTRPGIYFIRTSVGDSSVYFAISDTVFKDTFYKSLKGFYFQRCGMALLPQFAGVYARAICHINDGYFHPSTGKTGFASTTGGWHDAGDYGKYVVNAGISVGTLLMAYEYFPTKFNSDDLNIPESGNSIPDILDEVHYELNWLLKMQDTNGGVYFKVTHETFEPFEMPSSDTGTRYIYQISSTATADFAAVMARAARIYSSFDKNFSNQCLTAAQNAWGFLQQNPSIVPPGGFHNPAGTSTGEYGDGNDSDERLWASAELFATTGNSTYNTFFVNNYTTGGIFNSEMSWPDVKSMAQLTYLFCNQSSADNSAKANLNISLGNLCSTYLDKINNEGLRVALNPGEYYWGSNSEVLNRAIMLILGYVQTNNKDYYNAALDQLNYILGVNGNNISYVTGTGTFSPMHPHHRPSASDGIVNPIPGLMVGGPNQYLNDNVLSSHFSSSTPPALCYIDDQNSYASNEIAINWNAPLVFVAGYFNGQGHISGIKIESPNIPYEINIGQNYPNPFNGGTRIKFSLKKDDDIYFNIYNAAGELIFEKDLGMINSGQHEISWDGKDSNSNFVSSGVYFYSVSGKEKSPSKKMIYLK